MRALVIQKFTGKFKSGVSLFSHQINSMKVLRAREFLLFTPCVDSHVSVN